MWDRKKGRKKARNQASQPIVANKKTAIANVQDKNNQ